MYYQLPYNYYYQPYYYQQHPCLYETPEALSSVDNVLNEAALHPYYSSTENNHEVELSISPHQNLFQKLEQLEKKLEELEEENKELKEKLENIKPINIENINYKIQELTVKELSGTLNIGMTALTDPENIKKLMEEHEDITFNNMDTSELDQLEEIEEEDFDPNQEE